MTQIGIGERSSSTSQLLRIDDPRIIAIPDRDNNEKLAAIGAIPRVFSPSMLKSKIDGIDDNPNFVVREEVRKRLIKALELLPDKYGIVLIEGHRSYQYQRQLFEAEVDRLQNLFADQSIEEAQLRIMARQFVSDPDIFSPHVTGGAIDLALVDIEKNDYLDVGNLFQYDATAATGFSGLTPAQLENRRLLTNVMIEAGFVNYPQEWWHWSYGDKLWAFLKGEQNAIYGPML